MFSHQLFSIQPQDNNIPAKDGIPNVPRKKARCLTFHHESANEIIKPFPVKTSAIRPISLKISSRVATAKNPCALG
jgi:hypothetical protein